jgi:hypothetical protein
MTRYNRLSIAAKQAQQTARMREPGIACPNCGTTTTSADLIAHVQTRCDGPKEPPQHSVWVRWRDVKAMGVRSGHLTFWVQRGYVRTRGEVQDREYLLRDLAVRVAMVVRRRRRDPNNLRRPGFWKR